MLDDLRGPAEFVEAFLFGFPALFSVVNPIGGAFVFQALTAGCSAAERA
jgi:multiple antibiotic resistance protein